MVLKIINN